MYCQIDHLKDVLIYRVESQDNCPHYEMIRAKTNVDFLQSSDVKHMSSRGKIVPIYL
jgi:hypothetical protein